MRFGFMATKLRHINRNGWGKDRPDQKKPLWVSQTWRWLRFFMTEKGLVHYEFVPCGQTVNMEFYLEFLWHLRNAICRRGLSYGKIRVDVSPQCACSCVTSYLQISDKRQDNCCVLPTLLSRLSPSKLFPIFQIEGNLQRTSFQALNEIEENTIQQVCAIHKNAFQETFQK